MNQDGVKTDKQVLKRRIERSDTLIEYCIGCQEFENQNVLMFSSNIIEIIIVGIAQVNKLFSKE